MKRATRIIHTPYRAPDDFAAPQAGVFKASTVFFPNAQAVRERTWMDRSSYTYGLHGTPTTYALEERIAHLEGGSYCVLTPSGLSAIAMVNLALLKSGDHMLLPDNVYGPSIEMAKGLLQDLGITFSVYNAMEPASLRSAITSQTKLIWLEAPGSVTMEFPALDELVQIARDAGIVTALDNTWAAGLAFCGFELGKDQQGQTLGADIVVQALTKYPSGGGDVLMGSVVTRDVNLHTRVQRAHMFMGIGVAGNDAELVLRSLSSMVLRYKAQYETGLCLAKWCQQRSEFSAVLFPPLPDSPGYEHWQRLSNGTGAGLFSVVFDARYTQQQIDRFIDALKFFKLGYSWGGPISLVMFYDLSDICSSKSAYLAAGTLVRFSVGLEAVEDLQSDIEQALQFL